MTKPTDTVAIDYPDLFQKIAGARLLCIGDLILDVFIYGHVNRLSPEAPIPIVGKKEVSYSLGGVGNVAANIASLGGSCRLLAAVGDDEAASQISKITDNKPAITASLIRSADRKTSEKQRIIAERQQILRIDSETTEPISEAIAAKILAEAEKAINDADGLILSDYSKGTLPPSLIAKLIKLAKKHKRAVFVDPKGTDYTIYKGADYITPNRNELAQVTGIATDDDDAVVKGARSIIKKCDVANVLVTRSEQGMSLVESKKAHHIATQAIDVFDVAGAGDTVLAAFCLALAADAEPIQAATFANIAAGLVVEKSEVATVSPQEIMDRVTEQDFRTRRLDRRAQSKIIGNKAQDEKQAVATVEQWRKQGATIGFTNGCFDIVHAGHLHLLHQAAEQADRLIVAVNSDDSVRRLKGKDRPLQTADRRVELLAHLDMVDLVIVFDEDTPQRLIELFIPNVLIKGADYTREELPNGDFVESHGGRVFLAELKEGFSSTAIIRKIDKS